MLIKVQCGCGAKYSFDIEPLNGQMPIQVNCPVCGTDGTSAANDIIRQQLSPADEAPVSTPPEPAKTRLRVSAAHTPASASVAQPAAAIPAQPQATACGRHPRNAAAAQCFVCQKPICPECMSLFGYLCSVQCRFQAEQQKIKVPAYEGQKSRVEAQQWKKVGQITTAAVLFVLCLFVLYLWFYFVGSRPREFYSVKWRPSDEPVITKFIDKNTLLVVNAEKVHVHDLKGKKELWSAPVRDAAPAGEEQSETQRRRSYFGSPALMVHLSGDNVWVCSEKQILAFDQKTGTQKHKVEIPGERTGFSATDSALMIISSAEKNRKTLTRVDLASGNAKTEVITPTPTRTDFVVEELDRGTSPTAAFLLERELDEDDGKRLMKTAFSQVMFAGDNAVEMQVRLIQPNIVTVDAMKKAPAQSSLNANTSAAASGGVAQEIFNEIKRSRTGGVKKIDESRYGVTLLRHMADSPEKWSGEVTGPPSLFPLKTVDVLVAGKVIYVFDKQGKKLFESKLTYSVADWLVSGYADQAPCLEENGSLYFYDQGVLTGFDLPSGNVRWRVTSVGISNVESDGRGHLYVNTTTASPDSIQYSEEIEVRDPPKSILLKVDAKSGKTLWDAGRTGVHCEMSGKFLYGLNEQVGGLSYAVGLSDALGSPYSADEHFRIYRLKPSNGTQMWEFYQNGSPQNVDFAENRILVQNPGQVRVLKFLSF
jgi:outer membrane protein assembly factor BamB